MYLRSDIMIDVGSSRTTTATHNRYSDKQYLCAFCLRSKPRAPLDPSRRRVALCKFPLLPPPSNTPLCASLSALCRTQNHPLRFPAHDSTSRRVLRQRTLILQTPPPRARRNNTLRSRWLLRARALPAAKPCCAALILSPTAFLAPKSCMLANIAR